MKKVINIVLIMVLLVLISGLLLAIGEERDRPNTTDRQRRPGGDIDIELSKEDIPRLVEIIRVWKLVNELDLKEKQLMEFLPKLKELDELRFRHHRNRNEAIGKLRKLLESNTNDDQIKQAADTIKDLETKFRQKEQQLGDSLNSGLSIKQQAKYVVFQEEYWRDMQNLIRSLRELSDLREQKLKSQPTTLRKK